LLLGAEASRQHAAWQLEVAGRRGCSLSSSRRSWEHLFRQEMVDCTRWQIAPVRGRLLRTAAATDRDSLQSWRSGACPRQSAEGRVLPNAASIRSPDCGRSVRWLSGRSAGPT